MPLKVDFGAVQSYVVAMRPQKICSGLHLRWLIDRASPWTLSRKHHLLGAVFAGAAMKKTLISLCLSLGLAGSVVAQDTPPLVKLQAVATDADQNLRQFFGRVAAKQSVDLAFQVGGQLQEFPVLEGTPVGKGALIARLDLEPFELARDQAKAQADQANRTLERLQQLQGRTVSGVTVEDAQTQADLAALSLRNAERALEHATLHAPFDALVASRNVANFSTVGAGTPVARLHDMSELRVEIDVPEVLFRQAGQNPDFDIYATFPGSDARYPLTPREFNAETSGVGQTFRISLGMARPEDQTILPGASVTVNIIRDWGDVHPVVPISAVLTGNDGSAAVMVFTGDAEGIVTRTPVEIAPTGDGRVFVTAGLKDGEEIVMSGASLLDDGATVRRFVGFGQ